MFIYLFFYWPTIDIFFDFPIKFFFGYIIITLQLLRSLIMLFLVIFPIDK